jgi:hypothetical protein
MPQYKYGDMWSAWEAADLFVITTNSTLRAGSSLRAASSLRLNDKALVMGRGIARQAKKRFPGIAAALGSAIGVQCGSGGFYGLLVSPAWPDAKLATFQVKTDWRDSADLDLIRRSTVMLVNWCKAHPDSQVHLNFPGIGNGKRKRADVKPIIDGLPETVTIWEYAVANANATTSQQQSPSSETNPPDVSVDPPQSPPALRAPQFIFDSWDEEAADEAYAQFVAGQDMVSVASDSAEPSNLDDVDATLFAAGFKRGCAWRQARIQASQPASQRATPAAGVTVGRENGNALAGQ